MTADVPLSEMADPPGAAPTPVGDMPGAASPASCGSTCGCRQRLTDAIADAPPRRHELEVLRLYLDKQHGQV